MNRLKARLQAIDGRNYKAYKTLQGRYHFEGIGDFEDFNSSNGSKSFELWIDHVQGDPFADPSRIRLCVPATTSALPPDSYADPTRRIALEDFIGRTLARVIEQQVKGQRGSGNSGQIRIAQCGQQVLLRDAVVVDNGRIEVRLGLALPAAGRKVLAHEASIMLFDELPRLVQHGLSYAQLDQAALQLHLNTAQDQACLRQWLNQASLVAFVGDGAILPRRSGIDDRPLTEGAVPFVSPPELAREPVLPHAGKIRGMAIAQGVTLIVGGGFHGKSTLLHALERGVYDHIPGDGRERVITDASAIKIRSEDGRAINRVDISSFIDNLPLAKDTRRFTTENASGSTSQAANIIEALCCDTRTLLIDEDTSATNFMIRDRRMQRLVTPAQEPISPLIAHIQQLHRQHGVSTVLVTGGSSAYFEVADRVILMQQYQARDVSAQVQALMSEAPEPALAVAEQQRQIQPQRKSGAPGTELTAARCLDIQQFRQGLPTRLKVQAFGCDQLRLGDWRIDLGRVEQLVEPGQLRAIGWLISQLADSTDPDATLLDALRHALQQVEAHAEVQGLDQLSPFYPEPHGGLSLPRLQELFAAINRLRELPIKTQ